MDPKARNVHLHYVLLRSVWIGSYIICKQVINLGTCSEQPSPGSVATFSNASVQPWNWPINDQFLPSWTWLIVLVLKFPQKWSNWTAELGSSLIVIKQKTTDMWYITATPVWKNPHGVESGGGMHMQITNFPRHVSGGCGQNTVNLTFIIHGKT